MGFIPKPHLMLMTSANFTQKLSAFLFHRKYVVALKCKSTVVSYEIKNAPRGMRTSRRRGLLLRNTARARRVRKRTLCSRKYFITSIRKY